MSGALQSISADKLKWAVRVLGVQPTTPLETTPAAASGPAMAVWNDAKDAVDTRLNALFGVLRKIGLPELDKAADAIGSVLEGYRTGLTKALMNYDAAPAGRKDAARSAALIVVEDYKTRVPADKHVIAADNNPFDIQVDARATLGAALDQLRQRLAA